MSYDSGRVLFWLNVLSIGAAAWFTWLYGIAPLWGTGSFYTAFARSVAYVAFAVIGSAVNVMAAYAVLRPGGAFQWSSLSAALWYAPAMLLAVSESPASLAGSAILLVSATRALASRWLEEVEQTPEVRPRLVSALAISVTIHAAVAAIASSVWLAAAGLLAACVSALTARAIAAGVISIRTPRKLPQPTLAAVLTVVLAVGITLAHFGGWADDASASANDSVAERGKIRGVILTTRMPRPRALVAPDLSRTAPGLARTDVQIPFTGEYWIYRQPFLEPPEGSQRRYGTPFSLSYSTTDRARMFLQATQSLAEPMSLACCRVLRVTVRAQDIRTGSVTLNTTLMDGFKQSPLGAPRVENGEHVYEFPFPTRSRLAQFDALRFRFSDSTWLMRNPKVEIVGFTFVGR